MEAICQMPKYNNFSLPSALDRAAVVARAVMRIVATGGGEVAVAAYLRDEFSDIAQTAICEIPSRRDG